MNRFFKLLIYSFFYFGFLVTTHGQVEIVFPKERAVFQRDNSNNGAITISGIASKQATKIEGKLTPMSAGQGTETDWVLVDDKLTGGSFSGKIQGKGGWYKLQLREYAGDKLLSLTALDRVGIGEVFIVSGQSNAQGFLRFNPKGSTDDRVNGYGFYKADFIDENPTLTDIKHLDRELNLGPHGQGAWAWGELGDKLAQKLNVPVLFFNTAYEGTLIENWVKSAKGESTTHAGFGFVFPNNTPYSFLRIILQNHVNLYGLRSIIWIQGESDYLTEGDAYYADLKYFINKVGSDVGKEIPWLVTKTSLNFNLSFDKILFAQAKVIRELSNVFEGPLTDYVGIPRIDGVHLFNNGFLDGISELATSLNETLSLSLLAQMKPLQGSSFIPLDASCVSGGNARVSLSSSAAKTPKWSNGVTSNAIQLANGRVSALTADGNGNYLFSETLEVSRVFPSAPVITTESELTLCEGTTATFTTDKQDLTIEWHDGSSGTEYTTDESETVFAKYTSADGCNSPVSNKLSLEIVPIPEVPTITSISGSFGECEGSVLTLNASTSAGAEINWSDGSIGSNLTISEVGEFIFTAKAKTPENCESESSESVNARIFSKPPPPSITKNGPYSVGVVNKEIYESYLWKFEGQLLSDQTSFQISPQSNGFVSIAGYERHPEPYTSLCLSNDSGLYYFEKDEENVGVVVYPNPPVDNTVYIASEDNIPEMNIQVYDVFGKAVIRNQRVQNVGLPYELKFDENVFHGKYYLIVNYQGLQKKFTLFFE
ncbi:sialate O-acetylesterase [Jiulongibacter sp. NS-SX5]|uniref:sialate O-acetylesterase n=1 Tax=Jiulongibacter sp. NS-SX5 TaxID=3463854 RepID=UPI00405A2BE6